MYRNLKTEAVIIEEKLGEKTIRQYAKGNFLGKGGFASCYEFINLETKNVSAAKIISKTTLTKSEAKKKVMVVYFANLHCCFSLFW